MQYSIVQVHC